MTPVVNQAEFRTVIAGTPAEVRAALRARFTEMGAPSLDPTHTVWDAEKLYDFVAMLSVVAREHGHELRIPLDTQPLRDRIAALPDDLKDEAAATAQVVDGGEPLPMINHPSRWTVHHWTLANDLITTAEGRAAARHRRVMAALGKVDVPGDHDVNGDDAREHYRHMVVGCVTDGRTESSRKLTGPEAEHLAAWCEATSLGTVSGPPTAFAPDWKAIAKRANRNQTEIRKLATDWAKARYLPALPNKLSEITNAAPHHRLIAYLHGLPGTAAPAEVVPDPPVSFVVPPTNEQVATFANPQPQVEDEGILVHAAEPTNPQPVVEGETADASLTLDLAGEPGPDVVAVIPAEAAAVLEQAAAVTESLAAAALRAELRRAKDLQRAWSAVVDAFEMALAAVQ